MNLDVLLRELKFKAVRSSGPGGQHVNKTSSKVEITFSISSSEALSAREKERLIQKLASKISENGTITIQSSESRSQHRNKKLGIERIVSLLKDHLKVAKPRKKSKPSKGAIEKRLSAKKKHGLKKANRRKPFQD